MILNIVDLASGEELPVTTKLFKKCKVCPHKGDLISVSEYESLYPAQLVEVDHIVHLPRKGADHFVNIWIKRIPQD